MKDNLNIIEQYLADELSVKEQLEFEQLLLDEPELMKEYQLRKEINEAISEDDVMDLRSRMNGILNSKTKIRPVYQNPFLLSSAAAVVIILIVLSGFYFFSGSKMNGLDVFETYYSAYPSISMNRSYSDPLSKDQILYKAFHAYDENQYELSSAYFHQVLNNDSLNINAMFYLAVCEIELGKLDTSIDHFNKLIQSDNHVFWEQSHWYLALVYLKQEDMEHAKRILEIIINENMVKKPEVESILESLDW